MKMLPSSRTTSLSTRLRANNRLMAHVSANVSTLRCKRRTPLNNTGNLLVEKPAYLSTKFHILIHRDTNYLMLLLPLQIHAPSLTNDIGKNSTSLFSGEKRTGHAHTRCNNGALDSSANTALERSRHATRSAILPPFRSPIPFRETWKRRTCVGVFEFLEWNDWLLRVRMRADQMR